jgi:hypothetical protein
LRYTLDVTSIVISSASRIPNPNIFLNWVSAASWNIQLIYQKLLCLYSFRKYFIFTLKNECLTKEQ